MQDQKRNLYAYFGMYEEDIEERIKLRDQLQTPLINGKDRSQAKLIKAILMGNIDCHEEERARVTDKNLRAFLKQRNNKIVKTYCDIALKFDPDDEFALRILDIQQSLEQKNDDAPRASRIHAPKKRSRPAKEKTKIVKHPAPKKHHYNPFVKEVSRGHYTQGSLLKIVKGDEAILRDNLIRLAVSQPALFEALKGSDGFQDYDFSDIEAEANIIITDKNKPKQSKQDTSYARDGSAKIRPKKRPSRSLLDRFRSAVHSPDMALSDIFVHTTNVGKIRHNLSLLLQEDPEAVVDFLSRSDLAIISKPLRAALKTLGQHALKQSDTSKQVKSSPFQMSFSSVACATNLINARHGLKRLKRAFGDVDVLINTLVDLALTNPEAYAVLRSRVHHQNGILKAVQKQSAPLAPQTLAA